ncbi:MAG: chorismate-binding protein [Desulfovibrionaceae bacterium]|nr:chorismate-binding protein [Desulfovibrionaceae bacterium]
MSQSLSPSNESQSIVTNVDVLVRADISFALFREPGHDPVLVLQKDSRETCREHFADITGTGFVLSPFAEGQGHPVVFIRAELVYRGWQKVAHGLAAATETCRREVCVPPFAVPTCEELKTRLYSCDPDSGYAGSLSAFLDDLRANSFKKLVLSRSQDIPGTFSAGRIFLKACDRYPDALVSLVHGSCGTWIGASPEILVSGSQMRGWTTMALAGTHDRGSSEPWDSKNRSEQAIVADYIRQALTPYAAELEEDGPKSSPAGTVEHLRTDFNFALKRGAAIRDVVQALHPTPAVCGLPREEARRRILTTESLDRRYYAGFLGWWDNGMAAHLVVNLRCLKLSRSGARLYAGGGILPESTLDLEWRETCGKMCTMLALLGE